MAIDNIGAGDLESKAKKVFQDKILKELPQASRIALAKLINLKSTKIDWVAAHSIFSEYFPEVLIDSKGMTVEEIIDALNTYEGGKYDFFDEWVDNDGLSDIVDLTDTGYYDFFDLTTILTTFFYDYEIEDMREDCKKLADIVARAIYK